LAAWTASWYVGGNGVQGPTAFLEISITAIHRAAIEQINNADDATRVHEPVHLIDRIKPENIFRVCTGADQERATVPGRPGANFTVLAPPTKSVAHGCLTLNAFMRPLYATGRYTCAGRARTDDIPTRQNRPQGFEWVEVVGLCCLGQ
jgi:hypothetical protein